MNENSIFEDRLQEEYCNQLHRVLFLKIFTILQLKDIVIAYEVLLLLQK